MEYNFREIEKKWQQHWRESRAYEVSNDSTKPKFYVLDMFPYPSGAGLHVGHPLGSIASDIYARFKRLKGYNVLHPMGFDSFGLPAEQYAIETGQHPAVTTEKNIARYREQLDNIGFCYDWSREVRTSDPEYYKWTQWIFLQFFNSFYNRLTQKAERITQLIEAFQREGNASHECPGNRNIRFTAEEWKSFDEAKQQEILMNYRIAFSAFGEVNWCEALGTVLANDEVVNGVSERGGHPVVKKKMRQWYLRITEYADRLLQGLEQVDFSDSMKEMQRNWIGKSQGAEIKFSIAAGNDLTPNPSPKERGMKEDNLTNPNNPTGYMTNTIEQWKATADFAKANRRNSTEAEKILWEQIRNRNLLGYKFRRQHPVAGYIPDFVCIEKKLIVEIDGGYHEEEEQKRFDESRTKWLEEHNYRLVRVTNDEVINNIQEVLQRLKKALSFGEGLGEVITVYTTRPDTIFGADFMVLAPEHELVQKITSDNQKAEVEKYLEYVKSRSERERLAEVKQITGAFTGAYALNPFNGREIPVWISEYVLAGYGTGAIMAVPCGDQRDFAFAKHFNIPITNIIGDAYNGEEANPTKDAILQNSDFLNGMLMRDAIDVVIDKLEEMGIGKRQINYRMRDAGFSRQRYWGEPFPIIYKDGVAYPLDESELPLELPYVESYSPGPEGEGPLANLADWIIAPGGGTRETNTMPGYAGSSWYFLRYMDPHNDKEFVDKKVADYWGQVDLYIGGTEHAVGHLLYSRMWTKALYDLGYISFDEPYKKLVNQGMIQGSSRLMYKVTKWNYGLNYVIDKNKLLENHTSVFISSNLIEKYFDDNKSNERGIEFFKNYIDKIPSFEIFNYEGSSIELGKIHIDIKLVDGVELDIEAIGNKRTSYKNAYFILDDGSVSSIGNLMLRGTGKYICGVEVEKMSKSKLNVENPDDVVDKYGADTFRMYEMFLGPVEQSKPWDTKGIEGVHRFLRKFWRLFVDEAKGTIVNHDPATTAELKVLHKTIKKIEEDTERFSFNTAVSAFMVCVNDLNDLKCHKKEILEPLVILLAPYAPHIAEELWNVMHNDGSVLDAVYPKLDEKYLVESTKEYPISINGKVRANMNISLDASQPEVEQIVLSNETVQKWLEGKAPKKIIFVKGRMINIVI